MSFTDDFNACMRSSGLPTPSQVADSIPGVLKFLIALNRAWKVAGGGMGMTLSELAAAAAVTGLDEVVIVAGTVTVSFYLGACFGCLVKVWPFTGMSWSELLASSDDSWVQDQLTVAANDQGIDTSGIAMA